MFFFTNLKHLFKINIQVFPFHLLPTKLNHDLTIRSVFLTKYALLFFLLSLKNSRKKENI